MRRGFEPIPHYARRSAAFQLCFIVLCPSIWGSAVAGILARPGLCGSVAVGVAAALLAACSVAPAGLAGE